MKTKILLTLIGILLIAGSAFALPVTLTWDNSGLDIQGHPETSVTFNVYCEGNADVIGLTQKTWSGDLGEGKKCTVIAVDAAGNPSDISDEVHYSIQPEKALNLHLICTDQAGTIIPCNVYINGVLKIK